MMSRSMILLSKLNKNMFRILWPSICFKDNKIDWFSGWPSRYFGWNKITGQGVRNCKVLILCFPWSRYIGQVTRKSIFFLITKSVFGWKYRKNSLFNFEIKFMINVFTATTCTDPNWILYDDSAWTQILSSAWSLVVIDYQQHSGQWFCFRK